MSSWRRAVPVVWTMLALVSGCQSSAHHVYCRANDIPQNRAEGERALEALASRPRALARPLVIIYGSRDGPEVWAVFLRWLELCTDGSREVIVVDKWSGEAFASALELGGREVDVVAHGLGEAVARAAHRSGALTIVNLYSLAPLRHAEAATPLRRLGAGELRDLARYRGILAQLNRGGGLWDFDVFTYWAKGDSVAGVESVDAPPGPEVILSPPLGPLRMTYHRRIVSDPRAVSDVLRRLVGLPGRAE